MQEKDKTAPEGFTKVEDKIMKFLAVGDAVTGKLVSKEVNSNFGNSVYKIATDEGRAVVFGTAVLENKMAGVMVGDTISIVYIGDIENKKKGQHPIKNFDVYIKDK